MTQTIAGVNIALGVNSAALIQGLAKTRQAVNQNTAAMVQGFNQLNTAVAKTQTAFQRLSALTLGATGGFLGVAQLQQVAKATMDYADAWQEAGNKIAASQSISGTQARSLSEIKDLANEVRAPIADVTDLYAKMLRVSSQVGASERDVAQATETVAKAFKAGGASTLEQVNGIRQLAQALGSGILQGDELRSIRENAPLIAQAIADEFDTTVAGLKKLGADGELQSERVFNAILAGKAKIDAAFSETSPTFGDQFTRLQNSATEWVGMAAQSNTAAITLKGGIGLLADNFGLVANSVLNGVVPGLGALNTTMAASSKLAEQMGFETEAASKRVVKGIEDIRTRADDGTVFSRAWAAVMGHLSKNVGDVVEELKRLTATAPETVAAGVQISQTYADVATSFINAAKGMDIYVDAADRVRSMEAPIGRTPLQTLFDEAANPPQAIKGPGMAAHGMAPAGRGGRFAGLMPHEFNDEIAEHEKYIASLKAIAEAENEWITHTEVTDHGKLLLEAYKELPGMIDSLKSPMQQYEEQLTKIGILERDLQLTTEQAAQARSNAWLGYTETALNAAGAMTGALAGLFKQNKAFAIADVVVNTASAIMAALKNPPGPPYSYVYAAAAAVSGAAQLAAIMSARPGSGKTTSVKGGGGGKISGVGGGGGAETGVGGSTGPQQSVTIQIKGDVFGPEHFRKMVKGINGAVQDGTVLLRVT